MATATSPLPAAPQRRLTPKRIEAAAKRYVIPAVPRDIHEGLLRRWKLRCTGNGGETFQQFFLESVLRTYLAEDALEKLIRAKALASAESQFCDDIPPEVSPRSRNRGMPMEEKARIVVALLKKTPVSAIATNFGISETTVRRVRTECMPDPETVQRILHLHTNAAKYGEDGKCVSVAEIAERCHVAESIVSAVLSNHKPARA